MREPGTITTKVTRRVHQATAKMVVPHPVDNGPPRQRISRVGNPVRQRDQTGAFVVGSGEVEIAIQPRHTSQAAGKTECGRLFHVASVQHADRTWSNGANGVHLGSSD